MTTNSVAGSQQSIRAIQEAAIAISAKQLNPTLLNEEFLKFSGIVPNDWQLARQPILNPRLAQFSFKNGVSIVAQPQTVSFNETIGSKELKDLTVAQLAHQYVQKLPHAEYQTLTIGSKSVIPLSSGQDAARRYIAQILAPGPWQEIDGAPMQAGINLQYQLQQRQLHISINEAKLQKPDQSTIPALLFSSRLIYSVASEGEGLNQLKQRLIHCQKDWQTLQELIYRKFLSQPLESSENLFPVRTL